jgi:alpha-glucosidase
VPEPWWRSSVVYQIYPRSFADSDGDGVGDLEGIRCHLDHLAWIGVDAVWLSPFFRSPMADFGYDVADYCDVDPLFGDLDAFDRLLADAHALGIKVVVDLVPNHSSDQHEWFRQSRSSRDDPKRDWYVWRDPAPDGGPPNNWMAAFIDGPAWTFDEATGQYYLHMFLPEQPDLNWSNPEVEAAMQGVMRWWIERGVDGFRIDVVHCIGGKGGDLPDDESPWDELPHCVSHEHPATHEHIRRMRRMVDGYDGDPVIIGETAVPGTSIVAPYYGQGDELHLAFNFAPLHAPWDASRWRRRVERVVEELDWRGAWPTWVLSNHDNVRHRTRYGGSEERARAAAFLLLGLRGTPFLYAGEELGLEDAVVPEDRVVDPGGRDGCRAPIPWTADAGHGWPSDPWLPFPPDAADRSVGAQRGDEDSVLHLYRRLLAARRRSGALRTGTFEWVPGMPDGVLAWRRRSDDEEVLVAVNMGPHAVEVPLAGRVEVASHLAAEGATFPASLDSDAAVVLVPA